MKNKAVFFFLLMLLAHMAHVFEEIWGGFWVLRRIGLAWFLGVNWALFSIPVVILYFILDRKRWAFQLGILYAGFMGFQGIVHNVATIVTGRYFDGFAGRYSGIVMILISWPLMRRLTKEMPALQGQDSSLGPANHT